MSLSDKEILDLNELCGAVTDGTLTPAQRDRLARFLRESETARQFYVCAMGQSASLHLYAAEMHADAPEEPRPLRNVRMPQIVALVFAAAAVVALGFVIVQRGRAPAGAVRPSQSEFVARLTATKNAEWIQAHQLLQAGAHLTKGQRLELKSGFAEVTFDSGARVVLEGSTSLEINSAWDATLRHGTLKADVPREAIGFRVSNPFVDVVDLGTEFTMIADRGGSAEVLVNKGEVEAAPRGRTDLEPLLLRENDARRFAASGVSAVSDTARKFALFNEPLAFERFAPGIRYVHWSFDESAGEPLAAGPLAIRDESNFQVLGLEPGARVERTTSPKQQALRFDGRVYARAQVADISSNRPRTVAFWVRVPEDAQPLDTWMIGWGTDLAKLGHRPVHIGWNRRPGEGPLGALRTDFGGGHAIGTTNLRDGKWHHVAVFFFPGEDADLPVQVKQYVDGRLESSAIVTGTVRAPAGTGDATIPDTVWLGYRLTGQKQEGRRFRGDIDELFIADRALQPHEIVTLMRDNRFPSSGLVSNP